MLKILQIIHDKIKTLFVACLVIVPLGFLTWYGLHTTIYKKNRIITAPVDGILSCISPTTIVINSDTKSVELAKYRERLEELRDPNNQTFEIIKIQKEIMDYCKKVSETLAELKKKGASSSIDIGNSLRQYSDVMTNYYTILNSYDKEKMDLEMRIEELELERDAVVTVPKGAHLLVSDGQIVSEGEPIIAW